MRLIDADAVLKNLKDTKEELEQSPDTLEKVLTISMITFAETIIERFAERSE